MTTYISILRGINVSGYKKIRMAELKDLYEMIGFTEVVTYIQSGNVIFKAEDIVPAVHLGKKIEKAINAKYQFQVPVIIRTPAEIKKVLSSNPFLKEKGIDIERLAVTFLHDMPEAADIEQVRKFDFPPDRFQINGKEVFLHCPGGFGNTKYSNSFFENKLHTTATTRNWKTVGKLAELSLI
jgi:uncharacterized protein (DUF1697 family)